MKRIVKSSVDKVIILLHVRHHKSMGEIEIECDPIRSDHVQFEAMRSQLEEKGNELSEECRTYSASSLVG